MKSKLLVAVALLMLSMHVVGRPARGLPFINDDFGKALAEAKQRKLPLFVDVWAPW